MAEGERMTTAGEAVERLMQSEHVDVLRELDSPAELSAE